jgi:hypothetical protein
MIYDGINYRAVIGNIGATITRKSDGANVFMQGEDADTLQADLDKVEDVRHPSGPFKTYEQHIDALLDMYDDVLTTL